MKIMKKKKEKTSLDIFEGQTTKRKTLEKIICLWISVKMFILNSNRRERIQKMD